MKTRITVLGLVVALLGLLFVPAISAAAATGGFTDVPANHPNAEAINSLAQRGIVKGYGNGAFGPADPIVRGQVAGMIARSVGWEFQEWDNPFPDQGVLDTDLWRNVGALNHYDVARGFPDGTFRPLHNVVQAQMISFIARAMVAKGYWQAQPSAVSMYTNVPADSGHRVDLATYTHYVGSIYGTPDDTSFPAWDTPATRAWVAEVLFRALKTLPAVSVPVSGTGSFTGIFNITNFVPTNNGAGIAAIGTILNSAGTVVASNVTMPVDLAATAAANQLAAAQDSAQAAATCDILHLVLGPLDLNLLGLVVHLDRVKLDITAQPGAGNLLGNLLCAVAGLLNPLGSLTQILDLLNQVATLLNGLGLGNLAATAPATATGTMLLNNFTNVGNQILANGTIAGQPLSTPLNLTGGATGAQAAATCDILHLVLGPLDLNLLGLVVHLDRVKLDITAQPGAGNLLGNLLCAVAGLLNPNGSLTQILDLLNNILRSL